MWENKGSACDLWHLSLFAVKLTDRPLLCE